MRNSDKSKMTIGNKRTLKALRKALKELLQEKSLEQISIQELCDKAMVSRGTFYNYFYDKYDLLNYDWSQIQLEIDPQYRGIELESINYEEYMHLFLKNLINYLSKKREAYNMIIINNANSIFFANMHEYIGEQIYLKLREANNINEEFKIPLELLAKIYANIIMTIGKWWIKSGEKYTEKDVYDFFTIIIDNKIVYNS